MALEDDRLMRRALPYTKTGETRLRATLAALRRVDREGVEGDFVECGVWSGGHGILARLASPTRRCWLYDTFAGMTKPTAVDTSRGGYSAVKKYYKKMKRGHKWAGVSLSQVRDNFRASGALRDERLVRMVVGDVCQTLLVPSNLPERIAVLRLDTDWYESTKVELEVLWPLLADGGELIVDDYGHWLGARKAVDEYFERNDYFLTWKQTDYTQVTTTKREVPIADRCYLDVGDQV